MYFQCTGTTQGLSHQTKSTVTVPTPTATGSMTLLLELLYCGFNSIVCGEWLLLHCRKAFVILTIALVLSTELQLLTRIVPCGSQLWAIQHTWSTGTAEVVTRAGKFDKASDKCYTQQKGIVPLQRALIVMLTAVLIPICDL